jgi:hypothetical protein
MFMKMSSFWKCTKCSFEGRMHNDARGRKIIDPRVYSTPHGEILYRWQFLFKSHVCLKETLLNPLEASFGCVFCCARGEGTPIFGGAKSFLAHLCEHRAEGRLPEGEVLYRVGAVTGRRPSASEEFSVVFTPSEQAE